MRLVTAVIKPFKLDDVKTALEGIGVMVAPDFTVRSREDESGATVHYVSVAEQDLREELETLLRPVPGAPTADEAQG